MRRLALLTTIVLLALPAAASASEYTTVDQVFNGDNGEIPQCRFSNAQLQAALNEAPTYATEYIAPFLYAVQSMMQLQAGGKCSSSTKLSSLAAQVPDVKPSGTTPTLPASITTASNADPPLVIVVGLLMACFVLLGLGAFAAVRWFGGGPQWAQDAHHAWAEADYRLGALRDRFRR